MRKRPGEALEPRMLARLDWIEKIIVKYRKHTERVKIVFYKPVLKTIELAVKAEVAESPGWGVEKTVSVLSGITGSTGFPMPLDYVDQLAHVRQETRRLIYELIYYKPS